MKLCGDNRTVFLQLANNFREVRKDALCCFNSLHLPKGFGGGLNHILYTFTGNKYRLNTACHCTIAFALFQTVNEPRQRYICADDCIFVLFMIDRLKPVYFLFFFI